MTSLLFTLPLLLLCQLLVPGTQGLNDTNIASNQSLPEGYVPYPGLGVAYKIYNASVSWSEAEQLCVDEGAKLAVIDSIQKLMYAKIQPMGRGVRHVGLRRVNQTWVSTTYEDVMLSIPWAANEPGPTDLEIGGLDFAMVGWANTFFGLISGNNSTFTGDYICELPIPGYVHLSYQLPEGYVAYRDIGVAYKAHAVQASWNMARKLCFLEGAQLAVIDTLPKLYYALDQQYYSWVRMHVGNIRVNYTWVSATDGEVLPLTQVEHRPYSHPYGGCGILQQNVVISDSCDSVADQFICELPLIASVQE